MQDRSDAPRRRDPGHDRLVAEAGYHGATTKAIADRAGVSEGTIYRHFPDKKALFAAAVMAGAARHHRLDGRTPRSGGQRACRRPARRDLTQLSRLREAVLPLEEASPRVMRPPQELSRQSSSRPSRSMRGPPLLLADYLAGRAAACRISHDVEPGAAGDHGPRGVPRSADQPVGRRERTRRRGHPGLRTTHVQRVRH